jgi:hypothetical protein
MRVMGTIKKYFFNPSGVGHFTGVAKLTLEAALLAGKVNPCRRRQSFAL